MTRIRQLFQALSHGGLLILGAGIGVHAIKVGPVDIDSSEQAAAGLAETSRFDRRQRLLMPEEGNPEAVAAALVRMLRTPGGESPGDWRRMGRQLILHPPFSIVETRSFASVSQEEMQVLVLLTAKAVAMADSGKSLEWLVSLMSRCNSDVSRDRLLWEACETAATEHPRHVRDAMTNLPPTESREKLLGVSWARLLSGGDWRTQMDLLGDRVANAFDPEFADWFADTLVGGALENAMEILLELPDGILRDRLAGRLALTLANGEFEELVTWLTSLPPGLKDSRVLGEIPVERLARVSFDSISNILPAVADYSGSKAWTSALITEWVVQNPSAALSILKDAKANHGEEIQAWMAISLARSQPAAASKWQASLNTDHQNLVSGFIIRQLLTESFEKAESFAAALTDECARDSARKHIAWHLANKDAKRAVEFLTRFPEASTLPTVNAVMDSLIGSNTLETLAWMDQLPSTWQPGMFHQAAKSMADGNLPWTMEWSESIAFQPNRDAVFSAIAGHVAASRPVEAFEWVAKIVDPHEQATQFRRNFLQWSLRDHDSASTWLDENGAHHPQVRADLLKIQEQSHLFIISKPNSR